MNSNSRKRNVITKVISIIVGMGLSQAAYSQETGRATLDEVVVTASKRGAISTQDLALSVQAIGGDELTQLGATSIEDISGLVPGFTSFNAGSNQKKLKIRGISSSSESEPQETVGIYFDDVPLTGFGGTSNENGASPDISLFDLNRVEVIKGPSGTLYGAGSMGGTVRYISNEPSTEGFEGRASVSFNNVKDGDTGGGVNLMLNAPVSDTFALRFVGSYRKVPGYIDNLVQTGVQNVTPSGPVSDINEDTVQSYSLSGKWAPTDRLSVLARVIKHEYEVDGEGSVDADVRIKIPDATPPLDALQQVRYIEEVNDDEVSLYSLNVNYEFDNVTFTSATSYVDRTTFDVQDTSVVPMLFFGATPGMIGGPAQIAAPLVNDSDIEQLTQEIRLSSGDGDGVSWIAGLYYSEIDKFFSQGGEIPGLDAQTGGLTALFGRADVPFESQTPQTLDQIAVFGEVVIPFSDIWELTLGGRWFEIDQDWAQIATGLINGGPSSDVGTANESDFNPKVSLAYSASDDVMIYGGVSRGYRAGGVNQPVPLDAGTGCRDELESLGFSAAPGAFNSDFIWNYELGAKSTLADGRVRLNGAIYHIDWQDIQARRQLGCGFTFFANTAEAAVDGVEIDLDAQVSDALRLAATVGYVDSRLTRDDAFFGAQDGDAVPGVSDFTFSASLVYDFEVASRPWFVRADYRYASEYNSLFNENDPANRVAGGFGLLNLRLGVAPRDNLDVVLFINNATDELEVSGTQNNLFGDYAFVTRPRQIGIRATVDF